MALSSDVSVPLNYYAVFATLESMLPKNSFVVSEGANTMDIGRTIITNHLPRSSSGIELASLEMQVLSFD